jgi:hypothetical protein
MTRTRVPAPPAWPAVADAGHLLVSALHHDAAGPREPAVGGRRPGGISRRPASPGTAPPPRHEPPGLTVLARVADGLRALDPEPVRDVAVSRPAEALHAGARDAGLSAGHSADLNAGNLAVWPLFAGLGPLGALPTAPRLVRTFSRLVLRLWDLAAFQDDTELLMSELATNVIAAATGPDGLPRYDGAGGLHLLWARLLSDRKRLRIELWDTIPEEDGVPVRRQAQPADESGRGLELLDLLSATWGWEPVPGRAAKKIWAELLRPPEDEADEKPARTA